MTLLCFVNSVVCRSRDHALSHLTHGLCQSSLYQHILDLPDVDNARWSMTACPCGSKRSRKSCCEEYQIPLARNGSSEIDPRSAAAWSDSRWCEQGSDLEAKSSGLHPLSPLSVLHTPSRYFEAPKSCEPSISPQGISPEHRGWEPKQGLRVCLHSPD
jgi:hypothetical protein